MWNAILNASNLNQGNATSLGRMIDERGRSFLTFQLPRDRIAHLTSWNNIKSLLKQMNARFQDSARACTHVRKFMPLCWRSSTILAFFPEWKMHRNIATQENTIQHSANQRNRSTCCSVQQNTSQCRTMQHHLIQLWGGAQQDATLWDAKRSNPIETLRNALSLNTKLCNGKSPCQTRLESCQWDL